MGRLPQFDVGSRSATQESLVREPRIPTSQKKPGFPTAVGGTGYLVESDGKRYLDGSGGAAVSCLGHGDPEIIAAIKAQLDTLAFAYTGFFASQPAEHLADLLVD